MIAYGNTDQVAAFEGALAAATSGQLVTDSGLDAPVQESLSELANLWPAATDADIAVVRDAFAASQR